MRALVIGGFEPSGHDHVAEALSEAGESRHHEIRQWNWRDVIACEDYPVFHLHRLGVKAGEPELATVMDDPHIVQGLATDLSALLPLDEVQCVVSVHPWSTVIAAEAARVLPDEMRPRILDCHGEFTPFPLSIVVSPLISAYVGGVFRSPQPPSVRSRISTTGVPVRTEFQRLPPSPSETRRGLTINAGHGAWAASSVEDYIRTVIRGLQPDSIYAIGAQPEVVSDTALGESLDVRVVSGAKEIAAALRASSHLLTKGSGSALAEAFATGCVPLCVESGVFWEDEARAWLSAAAALIPIDRWSSNHAALGGEITSAMVELGERCRGAAEDIWQTLERRCVEHDEADADRSETIVGEVLGSLNHDALLPETSAALVTALARWQ